MSRTLLLVDDDDTFRKVLAAALTRRGFSVRSASDVPEAQARVAEQPFDFAVVDLRMPGPSGLQAVEALVQRNPRARVVVLTGYASIATAVEAIKLGAVHYLTKPADADDIVAAFDRAEGDVTAPVPEMPPSVGRIEWEHIQRVLTACEGNISEAARQLGMHRRTLQRKLQKRPVRS